MVRRGKAFLFAASLVSGGCASHAVEVRAIQDSGTKMRQDGASLGDARGMLALGNPGLALEAFRKNIRTQGSSSGALSGIAACYAAMGRFDIARSNYEAALALSPHDPTLLLAMADVLARLGEDTEAADARLEASSLVGASARGANPLSTVTVALPPARPASGAAVPVDDQSSAGLAPKPAATAMTSSTITVDLPPVQSVAETRALDRTLAALLPPQKSDDRAGKPTARTVSATSAPNRISSPRLERLSFGEVALVTGTAPIWRAQIVSRTQTSTTIRWVPVQTASAHPNIRVLNAARSDGLARRARALLMDRGWRKIEIGDAREIRATSLIIYPASRAGLGRSLAAQLGCTSLRVGKGEVLWVLLGRDSVARKAA